MTGKTGKLRVAVALLSVGLLLVTAAACGQSATTQDIQGLLQAVEGKEMVITLSDGTTARITVNSDTIRNQANVMVGDRVDAKVRVSGGKSELVSVKDQAEDQTFTGVVESMGQDTWVIGGRAFKVDAATVLDGGLVQGVTAKVEFITRADGSMLATSIETDADDEKLSGKITTISANEVVIDGKTILITPATRLDNGLAAGVTARVEFGVQPDGKLVAIEIETEQDDEHFSGVIESMSPDAAKIGGKTFVVNQATVLDSGLAVGVPARVEFVKMADGSMVAVEIETDQPKERVKGVATSVSGTQLVVDGQTFIMNDDSRVEQGIKPGDRVHVRFVTAADGSKLVTRVKSDSSSSSGTDDKGSAKTEPGDDKGGKSGGVSGTPAPGTVVKPEDLSVTGVLESKGANTWVIGGQTFKVDASTMLDTGLDVGVNIIVEYVVQPDGSKQARKIETAISGKNKTEPGDDKGGLTGGVSGTPAPGAVVKPEDLSVTGVLESKGADTWVIGGQTFKVDVATMLDTGLVVGASITVEYVVQPDGSKLARKIETAISGKNTIEIGDDKGGASGGSGSGKG